MYYKKQISWLSLCFLSLVLVVCSETPPPTTDNQGSQNADVQRTYRPLIHHFSSTGCGPCGRFGIPLIDQVAKDMGDSIVPLITHFKYQDPFITESSQAIEDAILEAYYSPQIWVNNENITFDILSDELPLAIEKTKRELRAKTAEEAEVYLGFTSKQNSNNRFDAVLSVENNTSDSSYIFVEIYAMEDSLIASQAGADPYVSTHYKVNRGGHFGEMGKEFHLAAGENFSQELEFIPCWVCIPDNTYFYVIAWKKRADGKFDYLNGIVVR